MLLLPQVDKQAQSPMKLYEYILARRPVILSDLPQLREVLDHETSGLFVKPNDPASLAAAIDHLASNPELGVRLATAAQARHNSWNWEERAKLILHRAENALADNMS